MSGETKNPTILKQETFDDMVQENIDILDCSPDEAVKDAMESLKTQHVNCMYIIQELRGEDGQHTVARLAKALQAGDKSVLPALISELKSDNLPKRYYACEAGCLHGTLETLFNVLGCSAVSGQIIECATATFENQPDWASDGMMISITKALHNSLDSEDPHLESLLKLVYTVALKHEKNRSIFHQNGVLEAFGKVLKISAPSSSLTLQFCQTLRAFLVDDDLRSVSCRAHDNARNMVTDHMALHHLCRILQGTPENEQELKKSIFLTLSKLLVRNEFCKEAAQDHGLLELISQNLAIYGSVEQGAGEQSRKLLRPCLLLLKAMCGNDEVKYQAAKTDGLLGNIVACLKKWSKSAPIVEAVLSCCQVICLREPDNCHTFAKFELPEYCVQVMKEHRSSAGVQRSGSMLIRNMVARTKELQKQFLEHDIETFLSEVLESHKDKDTVEAVRSAQRDLDIDYGAVSQWTGTGKQLRRD